MEVYVCGSCGNKTGSYGQHVDGLISEANNYYNRGMYSQAKSSYRQALEILERREGCSSCKNNIRAAIDKC